MITSSPNPRLCLWLRQENRGTSRANSPPGRLSRPGLPFDALRICSMVLAAIGPNSSRLCKMGLYGFHPSARMSPCGIRDPKKNFLTRHALALEEKWRSRGCPNLQELCNGIWLLSESQNRQMPALEEPSPKSFRLEAGNSRTRHRLDNRDKATSADEVR